MDFITPLTELQAVNLMLGAIGEQPINAIDTTTVSEASIALTHLRDVVREVQTVGCYANFEKRYRLVPDANGIIYVPENAEVEAASDLSLRVVQRGDRLYDLEAHSYTFTIPFIEVDIKFYLAFDLLPQDVRKYATIRAARFFTRQLVGSDTLDGLTREDEISAKAIMHRAEIRRKRPNMLNDSPGGSVSRRRGAPLGRF